MKLTFGKYEGAGNDFVIIDNRGLGIDPAPEWVAAVCDRRFGIGADGLMLLENDPSESFRMRYFNSDGPEATMCGNGGRCIVLFAAHAGLLADGRISFAAMDGRHTATLLSRTDDGAVVSLGMRDASLPERLLEGWFVDTGSPHFVRFGEGIDTMDVFAEGRRLRALPEFVSRGGSNFNFVEPDGDAFRVRTYERGVEDETLACGTGAVAVAVTAAAVLRPDSSRFRIHARGGELEVAFRRDGNVFRDIRLTGPARRVFTGELNTENF